MEKANSVKKYQITQVVVLLVIALATLGTALGLAPSWPDVPNPKTSAAEQCRLVEATQRQAQLNHLEEQKLAAEVELELEYKCIELAAKLESLKQKVAVMLAQPGHRWSGIVQQVSRPTAAQGEDVW